MMDKDARQTLHGQPPPSGTEPSVQLRQALKEISLARARVSHAEEEMLRCQEAMSRLRRNVRVIATVKPSEEEQDWLRIVSPQELQVSGVDPIQAQANRRRRMSTGCIPENSLPERRPRYSVSSSSKLQFEHILQQSDLAGLNEVLKTDVQAAVAGQATSLLLCGAGHQSSIYSLAHQVACELELHACDVADFKASLQMFEVSGDHLRDLLQESSMPSFKGRLRFRALASELVWKSHQVASTLRSLIGEGWSRHLQSRFAVSHVAVIFQLFRSCKLAGQITVVGTDANDRLVPCRGFKLPHLLQDILEECQDRTTMILRLDAAAQAETLRTLQFGHRVQSFLTHLPDADTRLAENEECEELRAELCSLKVQTSQVLQEIAEMKLEVQRKDAAILELGRRSELTRPSSTWRLAQMASQARGETAKAGFCRSRLKAERNLPRGEPLVTTTARSLSPQPVSTLSMPRSGKSMLASGGRRMVPVLRNQPAVTRTTLAVSALNACRTVEVQIPGSSSKGSLSHVTVRNRQKEDALSRAAGSVPRKVPLRPLRQAFVQPRLVNLLSVREEEDHTEVHKAATQAETRPLLAPHSRCESLTEKQDLQLKDSEGSVASSSDVESLRSDIFCERLPCHRARIRKEHHLKLDLTLVSERTSGVVQEGPVPETPRGRPPVAWWHSSEVAAPASARGHAPLCETLGGSRREPRSLYVLEMVTPRTAVSLHASLEVVEVESPLLLLRPPCQDTPKGGGSGRPSISNISISSDEDDIRSRLNKEIGKSDASDDASASDKALPQECFPSSPCSGSTLARMLTTNVQTPARSNRCHLLS
ncbi:SNW1 [Symbiodinium pilosum]|uniref:SNW1 protein n=1 Tax=Symbiodinium pilosum TaxID=2952 RepID=A0A812K2N7_SYMPI|nr:SNW1 [Symbiodinium pilosum]